MSSRVRVSAGIAFAMTIALAVAACSSSSSTTAPTTAPTKAPQSTPQSLGSPGSSPFNFGSFNLGSFDLGSFNLGSFSIPGLGSLHGDPGLEAKLPNQVCGSTALKLSIASGALGAGAAGGLAGGIGALLGGLNGASSFSWAVATQDPSAAGSGSCGTTFFAIAIQGGGDPNSFLNLMKQNTTQGGGTTTDTSLGGKNVTELIDSDGTKTYMYTTSDTLYGVMADDDTAAGTALSQLP